ncbi:phosphoribosylanthranilate isomerase [Abyssalbus ytuae]|uniref:N-(5'-phosphoribosyl)anthranilate isomerase n=1 Tax=Abyssalbus ytuae TaxID=2926907 RepID=A0A9E6ZS39_9FLAO|nr:phosphoribosylanthranilate isomerase [Abyssalbus ytuae]UOB16843.1 phosphoribosylanthranilate isomerase [Abyssalbus ytuae]
MKLKICGMKYHDNINEVAALHPDYLGFIFYDKSPRFFTGEIPHLPKNIKKVGVFVDAPLNYIIEKVEKHKLDAVQLHGKESPEFCEQLKRPGRSQKIEIIKVFSIKDEFDFKTLEPYEEFTDYFLFDTKGKNPGGNGYTFNWKVLENYPSKKPFFLSGGIGTDETEAVLSFLKKLESRLCYAIDVNSKFETGPGLKNIEKLKKFINHINIYSKH